MNSPHSLPRRLALLTLGLAATFAVGGAAGEDLLQIYREAQKSDPQIAAARAGVGSHAGKGAAGTFRLAAQCFGVRRRQHQ